MLAPGSGAEVSPMLDEFPLAVMSISSADSQRLFPRNDNINSLPSRRAPNYTRYSELRSKTARPSAR
jgi:hypothetical protein